MTLSVSVAVKTSGKVKTLSRIIMHLCDRLTVRSCSAEMSFMTCFRQTPETGRQRQREQH